MLQRIFHGIGKVHARFRKILRKKPGLKNFGSLQHVAVISIKFGWCTHDFAKKCT